MLLASFMVIFSQGIAYVISLSGLVLVVSTTSTPQFAGYVLKEMAKTTHFLLAHGVVDVFVNA